MIVLTDELRTKLTKALIGAEGIRLDAYVDCCYKNWRECECPREKRGALTIGIGRNLDAHGISSPEALYLCGRDIERTIAEANQFLPWIEALDTPRRAALLEMVFNLGAGGVAKFEKMIAALHAGDFAKAAVEALDSKWARQVKAKRANRIATQIASGSWIA